MSANRNLLLGILALQNNFISKAQLLAAFNAWVEDKSQTLAALLLSQKAVSPEHLALLEALAAVHLGQHDQDADKSLAALAANSSAQGELAKIADPEVQASLRSLVPADSHRSGVAALDPQVTVSYSRADGQRFIVLRPHAAGGLGKVSVALDQELNRHVALKEIKTQHVDSADARARFLVEAEITGALEHPGIVPVYSLGTYGDGRPYYAMRFIKGDSLKEAIERFHRRSRDREGALEPAESFSHGRGSDFMSLEFRKLLGRFIDVCNAIAYAHSRGVLHRDLKPGNIMLGKYGETLVVDWGLAKAGVKRQVAAENADDGTASESLLRPATGSGSSDTLPGSALGTPAYMSPEQAAGRLDQLGPQSDVYSLGATLYHVLTGAPPVKGEVAEIFKNVQAGDFPAPRLVEPAVPAALEAVCLKAMALRQADRYASARELAEEIEHWLADVPVNAWPEPFTVKARRWLVLHRTLVTGVAAAACVGLVSLLLATVLLTEANTQLLQANSQLTDAKAKADQQKREADTERRRAERNLAENFFQRGLFLLSDGERSIANLYLARALEIAGRAEADDLQRLTRRALTSLNFDFKNYCFVMEHGAAVRTVAFNQDGNKILSGSDDGLWYLWQFPLRSHTKPDFGGWRDIRDPPRLRGRVWVVAISKDGKAMLIAGKILTVFSMESLPRNITGDNLQLWSVFGGLPGKNGEVWLNLRDVDLPVLGASVVGLMSSPTAQGPFGANLALLLVRNASRFWFQQYFDPNSRVKEFSAAAFSPNSRMVLAAHNEDRDFKAAGEAWLLDLAKGEHVFSLKHKDLVLAVGFSPDGTIALTGSADKTAQLWSVGSGKALGPPLAHKGAVCAVAFAPDGKLVLTGSHDGSACLWEIQSGLPKGQLLQHKDKLRGVAFHPDGKRVLTFSSDHTARLWDATTGIPVSAPLRHKGPVLNAAISSDGEYILTGSMDKTACLWDGWTGKLLMPPLLHDGAVSAVTFSPDGKSFLTASGHEVRLWEVPTPVNASLERILLWAKVLTASDLNDTGEIRSLDPHIIQEFRMRLKTLGGAPFDAGSLAE